MSPLILSLLTFLAVALGVGGIYSVMADLFLRDRSKLKSRLDDEFRRKQREQVERSSLFRNLAQLAAEVESSNPERPSRAERFAAMVEQSGLGITPGRVIGLSVMTGLGLGLLAFAGSRAPAAGLIGLTIGAVLPILFVKHKKLARTQAMRAQLPETFDLMARVIRAGYTMPQALMAVADEFPPPVSIEFSYCYEQQNLGLSPEAAYNDLSRRTDMIELRIFVLALLVQQQTGGNLAELLDRLGGLLRERFRIRGVVQTLTAEGRLQAMILLALPPVIFLLIFALNPLYAKQLLLYPKLIGLTAACEGLGALWIRKIVNFEY